MSKLAPDIVLTYEEGLDYVPDLDDEEEDLRIRLSTDPEDCGYSATLCPSKNINVYIDGLNNNDCVTVDEIAGEVQILDPKNPPDYLKLVKGFVLMTGLTTEERREHKRKTGL